MVSLILSLSGCSTKVVPKTKVVLPPSILLGDCPIPRIGGDTVKDLMDYSLELQAQLKLCNTDKAALRAFYNNLKEKEE